MDKKDKIKNVKQFNKFQLKKEKSINVNIIIIKELKIYLRFIIQNRTILLSKLFLLEANEFPKKIKNFKNTINSIKGETEKDYELRLLESHLLKSKLKIKKDYLDKLSLLLPDSFKYKNYPYKRKHINNIEYKFNENNELRLTFVKPSYKNNSENINYKSIESYILNDNYSRNEIKVEINNNGNNEVINEDYKSNMLLTPNNNNIKYLFGDEEIKERNNLSDFQNTKTFNCFKLTENVKNILYNNNNEDISLDEQRKIYNKFKKKFPYFRNKLNAHLSIPHFNSEKIENRYINLKQHKNPKIRLTKYNKKLSLDQLISTANELRTLRDKTKLNKKFLSEDNILKTIKKEISFSLNLTKYPQKKNILSPHELFYYDAKKWKNNRISHKTNKNDLHFNQINKEIDETIKEMKKKITNLNQELLKIEDIKNKMKSQNKLMAVRSKSFMNYKSHFLLNEERKKYFKRNSKYFPD